MNFRPLIIALLLAASTGLCAQDFHNSFHQFAPMTINPALTGAFYGNMRINVIGRDQGRPITESNNEFQDISLAVDGNMDFGLTEGDWVSAGLNFVRSQAGEANFRRQFTGISAAYHLAFGKNHDRVFTLGGKYGSYTTGLNDIVGLRSPFTEANNIVTDSDIERLSPTASGGELVYPSKSSSDYMLGLMLTAPVGKSSDIRIGISSDHLFEPRLSSPRIDTTMNPNPLPGGTQFEELNRRFNAFVYYFAGISDKLTFNPNILYQKSSVSTNILLQALFHYHYNDAKGINLIGGLGVRLVNSTDIPIYLGADIGSWRAGISYDVNIGGLRPSTNTFGALEIGLSKILSWNKKAVVKPVFICPRL